MLRTVPIILLLFALCFTACNSQVISKQQYFEKGLYFFKQGNTNGAIIAFKKALERDHNYFEARYKLSLAYILQGKLESAEKELRKVLKINPSFFEAHMQLAKVFLKKGDANSSIDELNLYFSNQGKDPEAYEIAAVAHTEKKDYKKAEEILNKLIKMSPGRISSRIVMAHVHEKKGELSTAESIINNVLNTDQQNKKALNILANIKSRQNKIEDLINIYQRIVAIDAKDMQVQLKLGLALLRGKRLEEARETAGGLKKLYMKRPEGPYLMGLVDFHERKIDNAIMSFQESLKRASIPGAYYYLGLCYLANDNLEQATNAFQRIIDLQPELIQARVLLALTHLTRGRTDDAEKEIKEVLSVNERNAFAHNLLGNIHLALGKNDLAKEEFNRAIELNPELVDARIKIGAFNLISGNPVKAEKNFIEAVEINPDLIDSRSILAQYYMKYNRFEDAIKTLNMGLKENADDAVLYNIMAKAYLGAEDMENALESFEKAIALNSEYYLPYLNLGLFYLSSNEKDKAIAIYTRVLEKDASNVPALLMLAEIMEGKNRNIDALSYYNRAIKQLKAPLDIKGNMSGILGRITKLYIMKKDYGNAEKTAKEIISLLPAGSPSGYRIIADVYSAAGQPDMAIAALKKADKINPDNIDTKTRIGKEYMALHKYQKAIEVFKSLHESNPEYAAAFFLQAVALEQMGNKKSAVQKYREVLELFPDYVPALNNLAYLYAEGFGPLDKAIIMARKANKLAPEDGRIKDTLGWVHFKAENHDEAIRKFLEADYYLNNETQIRSHLKLAFAKRGLDVRNEDELNKAIQRERQLSFPHIDKNNNVPESMSHK